MATIKDIYPAGGEAGQIVRYPHIESRILSFYRREVPLDNKVKTFGAKKGTEAHYSDEKCDRRHIIRPNGW
jgi:hypothetical protein